MSPIGLTSHHHTSDLYKNKLNKTVYNVRKKRI